ncbi:ubiquinone biosynthesis protein [Actinokineospora alba]|uniref:Ubiquinone biosynthesis protein n=1 Tax=Actinokineospora alba TaxID=504798 RepID=A0A1H0WEG8_9PSEU|nr:AarF/UbiB family protein [Actinokineospora alba]TDP68927.1 ubiquinone biosynthesis protein [Actinokineospora alba]SDI75377.1 ubiquinone biosynthesis protein [Actinokineospora alba]SDP89122.1 ubiquinone biosynthesis protein [Actinokineospora alba]
MNYVLLSVSGVVAFAISVKIMIVGARRTLGVHVGTLRAAVSSLVAWSLAGVVGQGMQEVRPGDEAAVLLFIIPFFGGTLLVAVAVLFVWEVVWPAGTGLGPLGSLRAIRGRWSRARRYTRITAIAVRHGLGPYLAGKREDSGQARLARSLRKALEEGGVTFVKLGQVLSTRADLLPPEFIDELTLLQDRVAPVSADAIDAVLRAEFGAAPEDVFAEFDTTPLASASIAQVHRATLRSGADAVVKVQRPGVRAQVELDLDIVHRLARTLESRTSWARSLGVVDLADGFARALLEELDFRVEARNLTTVAAASGGHLPDAAVRLPLPHESTERVLVMERLDGVPLRKAAAVPDPAGAARELLHCLLRQVIQHGVFHADPHPGNILLLSDGRLGMLDFGSVGRLDTSLRTGLQDLLLAIDRGDAAALRDGLLSVVERPAEIDERKLERALGGFMATHLQHGSEPDITMFTDLFRLVTSFGLAVPPAIAAVFRALTTMEGTLARLSPGFDIVLESRSYMAARVAGPTAVAGARDLVTGELMAMLPVLRRLPRRIDRISGALEEGRLSVNVRLFADERDRALVTGLLNQVILAFIGATAGIMGVLLLGSAGGPRLLGETTLYQGIGYNLLLISALIGLRLLFTVFSRAREVPGTPRRHR